MPSTVDLAAPLRAAIVGESAITALLPAYKGDYPVFTRRPAPDDAPYPMIFVGQDVTKTDEDGIDDYRPRITRDVAIYGKNDTAAKHVAAVQIAYLVHDLFHRKRQAITVSGWTVTQITASGPVAAPTDDDQTVGRVVPLTVQLARRAA